MAKTALEDRIDGLESRLETVTERQERIIDVVVALFALPFLGLVPCVVYLQSIGLIDQGHVVFALIVDLAAFTLLASYLGCGKRVDMTSTVELIDIVLLTCALLAVTALVLSISAILGLILLRVVHSIVDLCRVLAIAWHLRNVTSCRL